MSEVNATERILERMGDIARMEIDETTENQIRRCLLDYIGCTIGGTAQAEGLTSALSYLGEGYAAVLGKDARASVVGAAFSNGFCSHVLELDDGHRRAMQHLGAPVFSVLAALSDEETSWDSFERAAICGYEIAIALGEAIQPEHKLAGFHATGTCGTIGATAAACILMGFDRRLSRNALSAAATSAAGLLEVISEGSELKPYNVAHACAAAVIACGMAEGGFEGPKDPIGGKRGFLHAFGADPAKLSLEGDLLIHGIYVKPYSACRHCHPAIECAERLVEAGLLLNDVESVRVDTYDLAVFGHDQKSVKNAAEAKMSTPFGVASALAGRGAYMDAYTSEAVADNTIVDLMAKICVYPDAAMTEACPDKRGAKLTVRLHDGSELVEQVEYPKGEPENPMRDDEMIRKAVGLMESAGMRIEEATRISDIILKGTFKIGAVLAACR